MGINHHNAVQPTGRKNLETMKKIKRLFIVLIFVSTCYTISGTQIDTIDAGSSDKGLPWNREGRIFSIFSIVQFQNLECTSEMTINNAQNTGGTSPGGSSYRNGTCLTSPECSNKGGQSLGSCAGGFGVCCVFMVTACGSTISQNCSYIKNPGFPNAYTATTACVYTIKKCDCSICGFRLDFEMFTTRGPTLTTEADSTYYCRDTLEVSSTTNSQPTIPTVCGNLAGQHMYIDAGAQCTDTGTINFSAFSNANPTITTFSRFWDIKVSQIPCNANFDAPEGCLQYHTGVDGRFESFNFPGNSPVEMHLQNQDYRVCIRQEEGYCCIRYRVCDTPRSYTLSNDIAAMTGAHLGSDCTNDYIIIEASSYSGTSDHQLQNKYCGGRFTDEDTTAYNHGSIIDCTGPFQVGIVTDTLLENTSTGAGDYGPTQRGVCLQYTQIPCSNSPQGI